MSSSGFSERAPAKPNSRVELIAVPGLPDFKPGDDLARHIVDAMRAAQMTFAVGDVLVVAQKVVSKCEGAQIDLVDVEAGPQALELAATTGKDARLCQLILDDASEVLRSRPGLVIVANKAGHVMANAGIDRSNLGEESDDVVLRLPSDSDRSARELRQRIAELTGVEIGVVINDSWGRAWRNGTVGHAVGAAGFPAFWDRRGEEDMYGRALKVTQIGLADEIAAAASLVMGAAAERQPVIVVRGLCLPEGDGTAGDLVRERSMDLFR